MCRGIHSLEIHQLNCRVSRILLMTHFEILAQNRTALCKNDNYNEDVDNSTNNSIPEATTFWFLILSDPKEITPANKFFNVFQPPGPYQDLLFITFKEINFLPIPEFFVSTISSQFSRKNRVLLHIS